MCVREGVCACVFVRVCVYVLVCIRGGGARRSRREMLCALSLGPPPVHLCLPVLNSKRVRQESVEDLEEQVATLVGFPLPVENGEGGYSYSLMDMEEQWLPQGCTTGYSRQYSKVGV